MQPWSNQSFLKKESIPSIDELIIKAESINDIRKRALFILAYLTAGRLQELCRYKEFKLIRFCPRCKSSEIIKGNGGFKCPTCKIRFSGKITKTKKIPTGKIEPSIKKKDISIVTLNDRKVLKIYLRNEKNKTRVNKEVPIPLDKPQNILLYDLLVEYINPLDLNDELFPFNYQRANDLLEETGFNPHFIRHIRATHLVTIFDFNEFELMKYMGWTDPRPAKHYLELKLSDVLRKL